MSAEATNNDVLHDVMRLPDVVIQLYSRIPRFPTIRTLLLLIQMYLPYLYWFASVSVLPITLSTYRSFQTSVTCCVANVSTSLLHHNSIAWYANCDATAVISLEWHNISVV